MDVKLLRALSTIFTCSRGRNVLNALRQSLPVVPSTEHLARKYLNLSTYRHPCTPQDSPRNCASNDQVEKKGPTVVTGKPAVRIPFRNSPMDGKSINDETKNREKAQNTWPRTGQLQAAALSVTCSSRLPASPRAVYTWHSDSRSTMQCQVAAIKVKSSAKEYESNA